MTRDELFIWVMHRFAEVFEDHAVIKGGMVLRLLDSPRATTDIDYVFVPYASKKEVRPQIEQVLGELDGADVKVGLHSKMLRADVAVDGASIQIEISTAASCVTEPMATGSFAHAAGQPSRIVRVMNMAHALSHKLAAWNERRLLRDLYDAYFLFARVGARPDLGVLDARLSQMQSRLPALKRRKRMSRAQFVAELTASVEALTDANVADELGPLLPPDELAGLELKMRAQLTRLSEGLA